MIKVRINIDDSSFWGVNSELLWASESGKNYILENSPIYAYGYSYKDIVSAEKVGVDLVVTGLIAVGGHSTYRILLNENFDPEKWKFYWTPLQDLGCTYESDKYSKIYSVDVSPKSDICSVYKLLERAEHDGFWQFEEGHCGHVL